MMNDANAKALIRLAMDEGRKYDHDYAMNLYAKAQGMYYANITMQVELEKAGLIDILKGVHDESHY
jgi:hypothetical protein